MKYFILLNPTTLRPRIYCTEDGRVYWFDNPAAAHIYAKAEELKNYSIAQLSEEVVA
jgi:hypothetical protein